MSIMRTPARTQGVLADTVTLPTVDLSNENSGANCYSGIRFGSDGTVYRMTESGAWQGAGTWLVKGTASDYYVARTINSGTLDTDAGDDVQLNANRDYYLIDTVFLGPETAQVDFSLTNLGGGTVYAGPKAYSFSAKKLP